VSRGAGGEMGKAGRGCADVWRERERRGTADAGKRQLRACGVVWNAWAWLCVSLQRRRRNRAGMRISPKGSPTVTASATLSETEAQLLLFCEPLVLPRTGAWFF